MSTTPQNDPKMGLENLIKEFFNSYSLPQIEKSLENLTYALVQDPEFCTTAPHLRAEPIYFINRVKQILEQAAKTVQKGGQNGPIN